MIRIRSTDDHDDEIAALDAQCFAPDEAARVVIGANAETWCAFADDGTVLPEIVGYAVAYLQSRDGTCVYLDRYGVLPSHAGRGIGARLLRAWLAWSKRIGASYAWTYTVSSNARSINALIGAGFRAWAPAYLPTGEMRDPRYCVWRKDLT